MQLNFRHGVVRHQSASGIQTFLQQTGNFVSLHADNAPFIYTISHYDRDYVYVENTTILNAWELPDNGSYWLGINVDLLTGERTFVVDSSFPIVSHTEPSDPTIATVWYDLNQNVMKTFNGVRFVPSLRVYAGRISNGLFTSLSFNQIYVGTQVNISGNPITSGFVLIDDNDRPLKRSDGTLITTEDSIASTIHTSSHVKFGSIGFTATCATNLGSHTVVTLGQDGRLYPAQPSTISKSVYGMIEYGLTVGEVARVSMEGFFSNDTWNWSAPNKPLYMGPNGSITEQNLLGYVPIGYSISNTSMVLKNNGVIHYTESPGQKGDTGDIGLTGDKGQKGDTGDIGLTGQKGEVGIIGDKGLTGDKGQKGDKGSLGVTGSQGFKGEIGATGLTGDKGEIGDKGQKGEVGLTGDKGQKGEVGDKGQKGVQGDVGLKGEIGVKGQKGDTGPIDELRVYVDEQDAILKEYVDDRDFLNMDPKAGFMDENLVPIYSNFPFTRIKQSTGAFIMIDGAGRECIFFMSSPATGPQLVYRAYRFSDSDEFTYDNDPVSGQFLNPGELVRTVGNISSDFIYISTTTRHLLVYTNNSSKWVDWTLAYDVTALSGAGRTFSIINVGKPTEKVLRVSGASLLTVYSTTLTPERVLTIFDSADIDLVDRTGAGRVENSPGTGMGFSYRSNGLSPGFTYNENTQTLHQMESCYYTIRQTNGAVVGVGCAVSISWYIPQTWFTNGTGTPSNLIPLNANGKRYSKLSDSTWNTENGGVSTQWGASGVCYALTTDKSTGNMYMTLVSYFGDTSISIYKLVPGPTYRTFCNVYPRIIYTASPPDAVPWSKRFDGGRVDIVGTSILASAASTKYGTKYISMNIDGYSTVSTSNDTININPTNWVFEFDRTDVPLPLQTEVASNYIHSTCRSSDSTALTYYAEPGEVLYLVSLSGTNRVYTSSGITVPAGTTVFGTLQMGCVWNGSTVSPLFWTVVRDVTGRAFVLKNVSGTWSIASEVCLAQIQAGNAARGDTLNSIYFGFHCVLTASGKYIFGFGVPQVGGTAFYYNVFDTVTDVESINTIFPPISSAYISHNNYGGLSFGYSSTFGYYFATAASDASNIAIFSSRNPSTGTATTEQDWLTVPSSRTVKYVSTDSATGLFAYTISYPIFLGGYYTTIPTSTLSLLPNTTNYVYAQKLDTDRDEVQLFVDTVKINNSFNRVLLASIVTNGTGVISQQQYRISDVPEVYTPPMDANKIPFSIGNESAEFSFESILTPANIVSSESQRTQSMQVVTTLADIFNSWYRFSHSNTGVFPANASETTTWQYDNVNDRVFNTTNSSTYIGLVSNTAYDNYNHTVELYSTSADNDGIGVIIAFYKDPVDGKEYTLSAIRCVGGLSTINNFALVYNFLQADQIVLGKIGSAILPDIAGWNGYSSKVSVKRVGNLIETRCTQLYATGTTPPVYEPLSVMSVDLLSVPQLVKFVGPMAYGYSAQSQASSSYDNIIFTQVSEPIYDVSVEPIQVYTFNDSTGGFDVSTGDITNTIDPGRVVFNPTFGTLFYLDDFNRLYQLSTLIKTAHRLYSLTASQTLSVSTVDLFDSAYPANGVQVEMTVLDTNVASPTYNYYIPSTSVSYAVNTGTTILIINMTASPIDVNVIFTYA